MALTVFTIILLCEYNPPLLFQFRLVTGPPVDIQVTTPVVVLYARDCIVGNPYRIDEKVFGMNIKIIITF